MESQLLNTVYRTPCGLRCSQHHCSLCFAGLMFSIFQTLPSRPCPKHFLLPRPRFPSPYLTYPLTWSAWPLPSGLGLGWDICEPPVPPRPHHGLGDYLCAQSPGLACSFLSAHNPRIFCVPVSLLRVKDSNCVMCITVKKERRPGHKGIYMSCEKV